MTTCAFTTTDEHGNEEACGQPAIGVAIVHNDELGTHFCEVCAKHAEGRPIRVQLSRKKGWKMPPDVSELRMKNLACWCNLDKPCHADVLLELVNAKEPE